MTRIGIIGHRTISDPSNELPGYSESLPLPVPAHLPSHPQRLRRSAFAQEKSIHIQLHSPNSVEMNCDPGEIEIVLNNLISNAVKYNRDNGQVDIDIWNEENKVTIAVKDTGIGMTPEESDKLFSEFLRIKNEKTRNIIETGPGLSIVKKIATLYQGSVSVESTPEVGFVFMIVLNANTYPSTENDSI